LGAMPCRTSRTTTSARPASAASAHRLPPPACTYAYRRGREALPPSVRSGPHLGTAPRNGRRHRRERRQGGPRRRCHGHLAGLIKAPPASSGRWRNPAGPAGPTAPGRPPRVRRGVLRRGPHGRRHGLADRPAFSRGPSGTPEWAARRHAASSMPTHDASGTRSARCARRTPTSERSRAP